MQTRGHRHTEGGGSTGGGEVEEGGSGDTEQDTGHSGDTDEPKQTATMLDILEDEKEKEKEKEKVLLSMEQC